MSAERGSITKTILRLRDKFILEEIGNNCTYWDINNGYCEEFAFYVLKELTGGRETDEIYCLCNDNFKRDGIFDIALLKNRWKDVKPLNGYTFDDLDKMDFGYHIWLYDGTYHYDAECPNGTKNFFELPIFKRSFYKSAS